MGSINAKIIIEHYINGGFGVFETDEKGRFSELMGMDKYDVLRELVSFIQNKE